MRGRLVLAILLLWTLRADGAAPCAGDEAIEIVFFDVGQGDCALVKCPDGRRVLIDCGSNSSPRPDPKAIAAELKRHLDPNAPTIHVLAVTHPDQDHYNLAERVLEGVSVERILLPGPEDGVDEAIREYRAAGFNRWLERHRKAITCVGPDDEGGPASPSKLFGTGETRFTVLAADFRGGSKRSNFVTNSRSMVLKISYRRFDAILAGDATKETESHILERLRDAPEWLDVELLKLGHHGSYATSTQPAWMDRLKPEFAVASAGRDNRYGHPSRTVVERGQDYYLRVPPHAVRWATRSGTAGLVDVSYDRAFWNTGSSGTVRVVATGAREREARVILEPQKIEEVIAAGE
ncbi:MAG: hypothetical protein HYY17_10370 [Planctomycetes bacterium]|nr:hypothetical protein [Planctomycetota bacterium]